MSTMTERQRERLADNLRNVIHDAEELLKLSAGEVGSEAVALRDRVSGRLREARGDITVRTSLLDARHIAGDGRVFEAFRVAFRAACANCPSACSSSGMPGTSAITRAMPASR